MLTKIHVQNYRIFRDFTLEFNDGLNILVGDNDSGKSTLLEAINLALTGRLRGQLLSNELSPRLLHRPSADAYVEAARAGKKPVPPELIIDLYLEPSKETAKLKGKNNATGEDRPGLRIKASFNPLYATEYEAFIAKPDAISLVPTEYYRVEWLNFAGDAVSLRSIPTTAALIDASSIRLQGGADYYLQQIISNSLADTERVELARAYRSLREEFAGKEAIEAINTKLDASHNEVSDKKFSLSIDVSSRTAWESSLVPHLDDFPIQYVGKGDQSMLKILLALHKRLEDAHVVLVEEPENHLSPASLNSLVRRIAERCEGKQVFITTHSSFVLNKLGLESLILLNDQRTLRIDHLPTDTQRFFKRLSGYDTLRVVLAKKIILVEGPSDDLVVQRAYWDRHGKLPMDDGVDVFEARGLTFKRFLQIIKPLGKPAGVVIDNDDKDPDEVRERFKEFTDNSSIVIHTGERSDGHTLEPQVVSSAGRAALNRALGKDFQTDESLAAHMKDNKTDVALRIFESEHAITFPEYINDVVA